MSDPPKRGIPPPRAHQVGEAITTQRSILRRLAITSVPALVLFVFFASEFIASVYRPRTRMGA